MAKQTISINGKEFELCKGTVSMDSIRAYNCDIWNCYNRPSTRKVAIWNEWVRWFKSIPSSLDVDFYKSIGVRSYNCNFFTIQAIVLWENDWYLLDITYANWKATKIEVDYV